MPQITFHGLPQGQDLDLTIVIERMLKAKRRNIRAVFEKAQCPRPEAPCIEICMTHLSALPTDVLAKIEALGYCLVLIINPRAEAHMKRAEFDEPRPPVPWWKRAWRWLLLNGVALLNAM